MLNAKYWKFLFPFQLLVIIIFFIDNERFSIWGQIPNVSIFQIIDTPFRAHSIRVFLVGGIVYLGTLIGYTRVISFNIFLSFLLILQVKFLYRIFRNYSSNYFFLLLILISSTLIPFFQNGRGVITCFGLLLLFHSLVVLPNNGKNNFWIVVINLFFSFLLLNVSSGAFLAAIISVFLFLIFLKKNNFLYHKRYFYLFLMLVVSFPVISIYMAKNIEYYDGSIINMLNHGAGRFFHYLDLPQLLLILIVIPIFLIALRALYKKSRCTFDFYPFFSASLIGLLFGFSAFFTFIYINIIFGLLTLSILNLNRRKNVKS